MASSSPVVATVSEAMPNPSEAAAAAPAPCSSVNGASGTTENIDSENRLDTVVDSITDGVNAPQTSEDATTTAPSQDICENSESGKKGRENYRVNTADTSDDPPKESADTTTAPPPERYARYEQIWDRDKGSYVEYTAPPQRKIPDDDELKLWFKIFSRREASQRDEKPTISIKFRSQTLINFIRTTLGGYEAFSRRPFIDVHELFPLLDKFSDLLRRIETAELQATDFEAKQKLAKSVGIQNPLDADMDEASLLKSFENLSRQLEKFIGCVNKEFEPILEEMRVYLSHGQIAFHLLEYMHKPGDKLLFQLSIGDKIAVRMTSTRFRARSDGVAVFIIKGMARRWNGSQYENISYSRSVEGWKGTKSVALLPWSILSAKDEAELTERGRIYCQYSGIYHVYNNGPIGGRGRAMVDYQSYQMNGPHRHSDGEDEPMQKEGSEAELPDEDLFLLPPTVSGFMLRSKTWVIMHVLSLMPVEFDRCAWDHLVLDPDTKLLIRSLVDVTCKGFAKHLIQDVITGKGGGLVSVLHGKPGTGKTLTAEAVAEHLERPIYMVGSEELPFQASRLESKLRDVLNLASRWDAVLLIDEADVFLEQRSMHEIERNAVVSVALRLLEYHSGVLFLTTNRIKSFDEAFLSRFSLGIKYPDLNQISRLKIWESFLRMANVEVTDKEEDLAIAVMDGKSHVLVKDLEELAAKPFNGRSIKNLMRTAQALALANSEPLSIKHLRIVVRTSERFLDDFEEIAGPGA